MNTPTLDSITFENDGIVNGVPVKAGSFIKFEVPQHWRDVCPVTVHASVNDELPPPNAPRYA